MKRIHALVAVVATAVALAAPAAADEQEFVRTLQTRYAFLSEQQLLSEGAKICDTIRTGVPASNVVPMVRNDLGVSISAAGEIVSAAVVHFGC
jgi:hypothetical protein